MLTRRKKLFIDEYIISLNATESAKKAGYSERTAYSQGSRLLKNVEVKTEIDRIMNASAKENKITKDNALKKLWDIVNDSNSKEADRIRAIEVISKLRKWTKEANINPMAIFQQIQAKETEKPDSILEVSKRFSTNNTE